MFLIFQQLG
uniref:Uncharacterized protein n=1 Tax=Rhizophora mucronata TaxID=61149 RepID=A0A2P2JJG6_RHIMU